MSSLYASKTWLIKPHHSGYKIIFRLFRSLLMSVKSLVKIEGYFYTIFAPKARQKLRFISIILSVKSPTT